MRSRGKTLASCNPIYLTTIMEKGERKLCIIIYVNYSITFEPPEVREAGALPSPQL